jgi:flavin-dependent thymidylate synthase
LGLKAVPFEIYYNEIMPPSQPSFSPEPEVRLVNAFQVPYNNAVATAKTCYSSKVVYPEDVVKDEISRSRRDTIAKSIYLAGHHTTLQHATFQFVIERVSRQCIWSFLHSHPFYNSEQVSQRYVQVSPENFAVPPMPESCQEKYTGLIRFLMNAYSKLQDLLKPAVEKEYLKLFPNRNLEEKRWQSAIKKRSQEVARYVLPLATHAHLYHTISGLTLLRYLRLCEMFDTPAEQKILVQKMTEEINKLDPEFLKNAQDPIPLEQTAEFQLLQELHSSKEKDGSYIEDFDGSLEGWNSKLIDYKMNSEKVMAGAVRNVLGVRRDQLDDVLAIDLVLNPQKNRYLSDTLNLTYNTKITRTMVHPHFTFRKKISHTADSQDQRHRMVPASRPVLAGHFCHKPDYITPVLIEAASLAKEFYQQTMETLWDGINDLLNLDLKMEFALYLLPNAFPIRFEESGSLIDFHHKWVHRLCYTAQEEIWRTSLEEVRQVQDIFPLIGKYLYAPCTLRRMAGRKPYCPEGDRFCGSPVWTQDLKEYQRIL